MSLLAVIVNLRQILSELTTTKRLQFSAKLRLKFFKVNFKNKDDWEKFATIKFLQNIMENRLYNQKKCRLEVIPPSKYYPKTVELGKNILSNTLSILNKKIRLSWLNKSSEAYKLIVKKLLL
jgi:hypothetical protein